MMTASVAIIRELSSRDMAVGLATSFSYSTCVLASE